MEISKLGLLYKKNKKLIKTDWNNCKKIKKKKCTKLLLTVVNWFRTVMKL